VSDDRSPLEPLAGRSTGSSRISPTSYGLYGTFTNTATKLLGANEPPFDEDERIFVAAGDLASRRLHPRTLS
jgi:hypothetical protein